jgi:hypothetical protein
MWRKKNKAPIKMKDFFVLGFFTTIYQLFILTVLYGLIYSPLTAVLMVVAGSALVGILLIIRKKKSSEDPTEQEQARNKS